jgi:hypothetical protein
LTRDRSGSVRVLEEIGEIAAPASVTSTGKPAEAGSL